MLFPVAVFAAGKLDGTISTLTKLVNNLIPLILAIAVLIFFWGLAMYLLNTENAEKKGQGVNIMVMGIIAIFVMVSIWGIIGILQNTFGTTETNPIIPKMITQ